MNFKKPFFIAEISANHEGSISKAYSLIKLAKNMEQMQLSYKLTSQRQ